MAIFCSGTFRYIFFHKNITITKHKISSLNRYSPCLPLVISTYWQSLGWVIVLRIWNLPKILMELGVRGRPLLPQTSWGRAEAKKVEAPISVSFKGNISFARTYALPSDFCSLERNHRLKNYTQKIQILLTRLMSCLIMKLRLLFSIGEALLNNEHNNIINTVQVHHKHHV